MCDHEHKRYALDETDIISSNEREHQSRAAVGNYERSPKVNANVPVIKAQDIILFLPSFRTVTVTHNGRLHITAERDNQQTTEDNGQEHENLRRKESAMCWPATQLASMWDGDRLL